MCGKPWVENVEADMAERGSDREDGKGNIILYIKCNPIGKRDYKPKCTTTSVV